MSTPAVHSPGRRRPWLEPLLWLGIPALLAIVPWAARQWASHRPAARTPASAETRLTGDNRRDRLALLERAWTAARPRTSAPAAPYYVQERAARREAAWLTEIALQLLPLDPVKGEQAVEEAVRRIGDLPERMGPEDLASPSDTPTGRLLRLAEACRSRPGLARRVRQAALRQARGADWSASRVYALCLIARSTASHDAATARVVLGEAQAAAEVPEEERSVPLAAIAGTSSGIEPTGVTQKRAARALEALEGTAAGPVARAVTAALIATAAPEASARLAKQAVEQAAASARHADDSRLLPDRSGNPSAATVGDGEGWPPTADTFAAPAEELIDSQLRRVAAALALSHPEPARRAAAQIRRGEDRSGALVEIAMLQEGRDPHGATALYRQALEAADQISRPAAARRAARVRAATGLAAFDADAADEVVAPLPPRLIALQINEFASRMTRTDPEAALRLVERAEAALSISGNSRVAPFGPARAAIAEQIARRDPRRAASLLPPLPGRRGLDGWLALSRGMADEER